MPTPLEPDERSTLELRHALDQLEHLTMRLRMFARLIVTCTAMSMVASLMSGLLRPTTEFVRTELLLTSILIPLLSIGFIVLFDSLKRKGDVVFKELSDELQWYVRYGPEEKSKKIDPSDYNRPALRTRIVLREYAYSTTLPLLSSAANGPALYAIVNLAFAFVTVLLGVVIRPLLLR